MGKTSVTTCKLCRREGVSLCGREKCAYKRRSYPPGVHGNSKKPARLSGYGIQLREKQKAKRLYNVMERQFRRYFEAALHKKGNTASLLVQILEQRLDNVVYRLGFALTRRQARQMVSHGFMSVNGKKVNIPSYAVRVGDEIQIHETKRDKKLWKEREGEVAKVQPSKWLHLDTSSLKGKVVSVPEGEDLAAVFDPTLIVELYSR
ncbi:30S ribosomal protein S4 [Candidatus Uhrbacteria bacterium]|nr:30S ribosomal protein S4 [Candidatus Uhrbacteria bacterium]